ncbi:hypothetical protein Glove_365g204 [Diversispora epigaea]|uniref:Uncharacterized protein n=1 Tax=Diversispora epigaea TaxID=1348612 RepID=A0A397HB02_9GLOM|nr:hypothetical protein Glove_365g204 [Diversispora epigaea]
MNLTTKVKNYIVKVIKEKKEKKEKKKSLKKERKLKAKEVMEEVFELEKEKKLVEEERDGAAGFDYPRIFFLTKVVDGEVLFGDIVFGEPKDQEGMYVEFKGEGWNEV